MRNPSEHPSPAPRAVRRSSLGARFSQSIGRTPLSSLRGTVMLDLDFPLAYPVHSPLGPVGPYTYSFAVLHVVFVSPISGRSSYRWALTSSLSLRGMDAVPGTLPTCSYS